MQKKFKMGTIELKNIRIFAFHGCLKQETKIGSDYIVNLKVAADLNKASSTDELIDTIDYVHLQKIVKEEMGIPSKLLEHVCARIIERIKSELLAVENIEVTVSKINPPIGGDVDEVSVSLKS